MKTYGCIDDCLDQKIFDELVQVGNLVPYLSGDNKQYTHILNQYQFHSLRWRFGFDAVDEGVGIYWTDSCDLRPQLTYPIFLSNNNNISNELYTQFYMRILYFILDKHFDTNQIGKEIDVRRIKINLGTKAPSKLKHLVPHKDELVHHLSMTLMIGQSDGDHIVFEETDTYLRKKQSKDLTVLDQYKHKNNRLVYNFGHYHCNYDPVEHDFRLVINFVVNLR